MGVRPLSNFLRRASEAALASLPKANHTPIVNEDIVVRLVRREEVHNALRLVLSAPGRLADEKQIADFLEYAKSRSLDPARIWIATRGTRLLWATLPVLSPGRTMLLLVTPPIAIGRDAAAPPAVVEAVCRHYSAEGLHLAQVLLDPSDAIAKQLYLSAGFRFMADLIYLQAQVKKALPPPPLPAGLVLLSYSPELHRLFADTISQSYHQTLDCPGLNGMREIDDVVAGHKASGEFYPEFWQLLYRPADSGAEDRPANEPRPSGSGLSGTVNPLPDGRGSFPAIGAGKGMPLGVLLLARMARSDAMELVYLGLTPAARGMGLGDLLMRQALSQVHIAGVSRLTLAVDALNTPATRLYYRHGMHRIGAKAAMMRDLRPEQPVGSTDLSTSPPQSTSPGG